MKMLDNFIRKRALKRVRMYTRKYQSAISKSNYHNSLSRALRHEAIYDLGFAKGSARHSLKSSNFKYLADEYRQKILYLADKYQLFEMYTSKFEYYTNLKNLYADEISKLKSLYGED